MGRTIPTHRMAVDLTEKKFKDFRNTLRHFDRKRLDRIFDFARKLGDEGTMVNVPNKVDMVLLSALIEMIGRIEDLETVTDEKWE